MSKINVNQVDTQCGSTLTLGSSGKTVTLASGASQSGFGRTGTVDWCTTAKTSPLTVASGNGYFINTTSGAITVTLPASPSAGDIVALKDYANTWDTNSVTVGRNGSKINGECADAVLNTESQSVTLIYVDGTKGWQDIHDSTSDITGTTFISASGGTETTCGNFKIHTFTSDGTFTVSAVSNLTSFNDISYIVVAGGGAGSNACAATNGFGGGGGAGGFRENKGSQDTYTASPLNGSTPITVTATSFPITVGSGGAGAPAPVGVGGNGNNSVFSTITSAGGGGGSYNSAAGDGGSGGGAGNCTAAGNGNTPPVSPPQGNNGGAQSPNSSGGGGGATAAGGNGSPGGPAGPGGAGASSSITGSSVARAGGGGGGGNCGETGGGTGGTGGGGAGGDYPANPGTNGTANTGGGGGATSAATPGPAVTAGAGGSGVVILRYRYQ